LGGGRGEVEWGVFVVGTVVKPTALKLKRKQSITRKAIGFNLQAGSSLNSKKLPWSARNPKPR